MRQESFHVTFYVIFFISAAKIQKNNQKRFPTFKIYKSIAKFTKSAPNDAQDLELWIIFSIFAQ
jgi:hypothetical protein